MTDGEQDYLAFLLRLWRTGSGESAEWHASLQDARTGQQIGFACLDDAVAYLKQRMSKGGSKTSYGTEGACVSQGPS